MAVHGREVAPAADRRAGRLRYRNLVGQRYLDIEQGPGDTNKMLASGDTIPLKHTKPAVDLTVLFQGFQPLVRGLDAPRSTGSRSRSSRPCRARAARYSCCSPTWPSLTGALADKDQLIGDVIHNLTSVLTTLGERDTELSQLIIQLRHVHPRPGR